MTAEVKPDVVILDLMLPDLTGYEVCRRMRADPLLGEAGILILTARGEEIDRIAGFEVGADDYVVKPFSVREVVLRVQSLMRRVAERSEALACWPRWPATQDGSTRARSSWPRSGRSTKR